MTTDTLSKPDDHPSPPSDSGPNFSEIPSVEHLLARFGALPEFAGLVDGEARLRLRNQIRGILDGLRREFRKISATDRLTSSEIVRRVERDLLEWLAGESLPNLRAVINATGVVLHTNLGRAPLAPEAVAAVAEIAGGYSNLEYDLEQGRRGHRHLHCEALLKHLLGCEAAVAVNNCAAAVLLVLDTFCRGGEVIVSRGELIEIGGGFRIPEVMRKSGAVLREVGTTNRTRLSDYEQAVTAETKMILKVHPSNFRVVGFTESPDVEDLADLSRRRNILFFEDLGSGALRDLTDFGINEPQARASFAAGVDLAAFSADKLLGGPQAGIIGGRTDLLDEIRRNPLMRALRVDKMTYAALEATLRLYRDGKTERIPVLAALGASPGDLRKRASSFVRRLKRSFRNRNLVVEVVLRQGFSLVGGGAAPEVRLPTTVIALRRADLSASEFEARLRRGQPAVLVRVEDDWVLLDLRTVFPNRERELLDALTTAVETTVRSQDENVVLPE